MLLTLLVMIVFAISPVGLAGYCCLTLLKTARCREDAEDERLWRYLLDPCGR